ncbi:MAG: prephenate dehydrogenase [Candidatus Auribacter fodinae]|jgi:prephenate dehydrogenase|uniref:Prephenate dehydrogenase n=1 Tax=Candidatus Auribacter fodinae TaxID=2093366 RepID=A0A3A4RCZ3_9BACT|nr:MAG: prephenate dehydrogenase [Candidatus Auribacter fodinae]
MIEEPDFKHVAIIGMGLMGGSLGKALIKYSPSTFVTGIVRREEAVQGVLDAGAAHECTTDIPSGLAQADLVVLSTPVRSICSIGKAIMPFLKKGCILTDMGSTKSIIVEELTEVCPENVYFVGAHPMAGSEKTSIKYADADLFRNALCIVTPSPAVPSDLSCRVSRFWNVVGCKIKTMSAADHDKLVCAISHIPHLVASSLVNFAESIQTDEFSSLELASTGFGDTTRIAAGSADVWKDICMTNKQNIVSQLDKCATMLSDLSNMLKCDAMDNVVAFLENARIIRQSFDK